MLEWAGNLKSFQHLLFKNSFPALIFPLFINFTFAYYLYAKWF